MPPLTLVKRAGRRIKYQVREWCGWQRKIFYCLDLDSFSLPPGSWPDLNFRRLSEDEWIQLAADPGLKITPYEMEDSLEIMAQGDQCWASEIDGQIENYLFVRLDGIKFTKRVHLDLAPDAVYGFRMVTRPAARNRGLASTAIALSAQGLRESGYRRYLSMVEVDNRASRRAMARVGFYPIGSLWLFYFLKREMIWIPRPLIDQITKGPARSPDGPWA